MQHFLYCFDERLSLPFVHIQILIDPNVSPLQVINTTYFVHGLIENAERTLFDTMQDTSSDTHGQGASLHSQHNSLKDIS